MSRKYVLHPGKVVSKSDGDRHFIGAAQLADLYNVSLRDCINADSMAYKADHRDYADAIHLYPNFHGDYALPVGAA